MTLLLTEKAQTARIFSYGGGVQSNAVLALQAQGKLRNPYDVFVFANVGEDSENPATLEYIEEYAKPFAARHGIELIEVQATYQGKPDTILSRIKRTKASIGIPAYQGSGGPMPRSCTVDFKIRVLRKYMAELGARWIVSAQGISTDEYFRARSQEWHHKQGKEVLPFWERFEYPLIDLRINRMKCHDILRDSEMPIAPKSSCYFCPYTSNSEWIEMKRDNPELFEKAAQVEDILNEKHQRIGINVPLTLHRSKTPLRGAVGDQLPMFPDWEMDMCESGYCMT